VKKLVRRSSLFFSFIILVSCSEKERKKNSGHNFSDNNPDFHVLAGFLDENTSEESIGPACNLLKVGGRMFSTTKACFEFNLNKNFSGKLIVELNSKGNLDRSKAHKITKLEEKEGNPYVLFHTTSNDSETEKTDSSEITLHCFQQFSPKNDLSVLKKLILLGLPTFEYNELNAVRNEAEFVFEEYTPLKRNGKPDETQKINYPGITLLAKGTGKSIHTLRKSGLVFIELNDGSTEFAGMADFIHWKQMHETQNEVKYPILPWTHLCNFENLRQTKEFVSCQ
jgi:hypothetical protein